MKARVDFSASPASVVPVPPAASAAPPAPMPGPLSGREPLAAAVRLSSAEEPSLREIDELLACLARIEDMRKIMDETIRLYYQLNHLTAAQQRSLGLHELLFPQYWPTVQQAHPPTHHHGPALPPSHVVLARAALAVRNGQILPHAQGGRPTSPPLVGVALNARSPIAPLPVASAQLAQLPPPPLPNRLRDMLESALATPWDAEESMQHYRTVDRQLTPQQIQEALAALPELEAALGMPLSKTPLGDYGTRVNVAAPGGFQQLASERFGGKASATGAYLHRLVGLYQDYKAEYYGLKRAITQDLYHRDPCSHVPRVSSEDAMRYLEEKYAVAMEGLLWRVARTSSPIMLDLDGDGQLAVTGRSTAQERIAGNGFVAEGAVNFDLDGDGRMERIEWMAGDGMLVDDRDGGATRASAGNGEIDGKRLFGDEGGRYANGYEKLRALDADGDGKLTGAELDGLKIWVDDGDARLQAGELKSMADLGISAIDTRMTRERAANGEELMRSTFVQHGETKISEDVWFARG